MKAPLISNSEEEKRAVEDDDDSSTNPGFTIALYSGKPVKNAIFLLSAPNSVWLKKHNWVHGPIPCDVEINYQANKSRTPLVQRILFRQKKIRRKGTGLNRKNLRYLNMTNSVYIGEGELSNEEVRGREWETVAVCTNGDNATGTD